MATELEQLRLEAEQLKLQIQVSLHDPYLALTCFLCKHVMLWPLGIFYNRNAGCITIVI